MKHFHILRHCRTEFNEQEIVQGACDSPLSARGRDQADAIGDMLAEVHFDHVFTGKQGRHVETARRILDRNRRSEKMDPLELEGLNEHNLGAFDMGEERDLYDASSRLYEKRHHLKEGSVNTRDLLFRHDMTMVELAGLFHDMDKSGRTETVEEVEKRSMSSMNTICRMVEEDSCNLIISSGGTLAILLNALTGREEEGCVMHHGDCQILLEDHAAFERIGSYHLR